MDRAKPVVLKCLIIIVLTCCTAFYDSNQSNLNMFAAGLISAILFVTLSTWLFFLRKRTGSLLDTSISVTGNFWPMTRYPFQYWAFAATATIFGGSVCIVRTSILDRGNFAYGATLLGVGLAIAVALFIQRYLQID